MDASDRLDLVGLKPDDDGSWIQMSWELADLEPKHVQWFREWWASDRPADSD